MEQYPEKNGKKLKQYMGSASYEVSMKKAELNNEKKEVISVEGEKMMVAYRGSIKPIIKKFLGSLASGMTYIGAKKMVNLIGKADFIEMTSAGKEESRAHGIKE